MDARFHLFKIICISVLVGSFFTACSSKKTTPEANELDVVPSDSQRIENLSQTVSRMQSRIEELDAKLTSLNDKLPSSNSTIQSIETKDNTIKLIPTDAHSKAEPIKKKLPKKVTSKIPVSKPSSTTMVDEITASFMKASSLFKDAKYSDAIIEFNKFTENYPDHILAGSAQFYIGESYYQLGEYKLASSEFEKTISVFPSSPRVVNAQLRLAQCMKNLGKPADSEAILANAKKLYSGNPSFEQFTNQNSESTPTKSITKTTNEIQPAEHSAVEKKKPTPSQDDVLVEETLPLEPMGLEQQPKTHE